MNGLELKSIDSLFLISRVTFKLIFGSEQTLKVRIMTKTAHRIYIATFVIIVISCTAYLSYFGISYYSTSLEERFYHPHHDLLKPSGALGHGLGIIGTLFILIGVSSYIARKRYKFLARFGRLKYWLEFHIFLCVLGPILILFHTAFKFGGIVSISFWSMVAVVLSGVMGRFIYIQIPRTIEGRELNLEEVIGLRTDLGEIINKPQFLSSNTAQVILQSTKAKSQLNKPLLIKMLVKYWQDRKTISELKTTMKNSNLHAGEIRKIIKLVKKEIALNNKIDRLKTMKKLFKYWHVAHLPFALIMLIIMVIHVGITLAFGYKWIF